MTILEAIAGGLIRENRGAKITRRGSGFYLSAKQFPQPLVERQIKEDGDTSACVLVRFDDHVPDEIFSRDAWATAFRGGTEWAVEIRWCVARGERATPAEVVTPIAFDMIRSMGIEDHH